MRRESTMTTTRSLRIILLGGALWLAACGSDNADGTGDDTAAPATEQGGLESTSAADDATTTPESSTTDAPTANPPEEPPASDAARPDPDSLPDAVLTVTDEGPTEVMTLPAMGGVRFEAAAQHKVIDGNDTVVVLVDESDGGTFSEANIGVITQSVSEAPIASLADYMDAVAIDPDAQVEPTGDALDLFGYRLTGFEVSNDATEEDPMLFAGDRLGAPVTSVFAPFPYSRVYLAETPAGLLKAAMEGTDAEHAELAFGAFSRLVGSAELTGPGLDAPLPPGEVIESSTPGPPPDPAPLVEDGPPPLEAVFAPVDAGTYQLLNTGMTATIDVPEGWFVQPNFPGIIVFTPPNSQGPGDSDLIILRNVVEHLPTGAGPHAVGPVQPIDDIDDFVQNPPQGTTVSGVTEVDFGALSGTQFDLAIDPDADCTDDDPCTVSFLTTFGQVRSLQANSLHRIWWIDTPDGSLMMSATDAGDDGFIDRVTDLALSLDISSSTDSG